LVLHSDRSGDAVWTKAILYLSDVAAHDGDRSWNRCDDNGVATVMHMSSSIASCGANRSAAALHRTLSLLPSMSSGLRHDRRGFAPTFEPFTGARVWSDHEAGIVLVLVAIATILPGGVLWAAITAIPTCRRRKASGRWLAF